MSIKYYTGGVPAGPTNPEQLAEALDLLHTQVFHNFGPDSPYLGILENAWDEVEECALGDCTICGNGSGHHLHVPLIGHCLKCRDGGAEHHAFQKGKPAEADVAEDHGRLNR